jgi:glycogen(starch) synthase
MKVLVLTSLYPPHALGGYEQACRDVVDRWRQSGHDVQVLCTETRLADVADPDPADDAHVRRRLRWFWRDHELLRPPRREQRALVRYDLDAMAGVLAEFEPDVVSVWQMGALPLALLSDLAERHVPLVHVVFDDWLLYGPQVDPWSAHYRRWPRPLAALARRMWGVPTRLGDLGRAGTFCWISATTRDRAVEHSGFTFPDSTVVYCGFDQDDFPVAAGPDGRPWRGRLLLPVRIDPRKGIADAIRAVAVMPAFELVVDGRGDERHREELDSLVAELGVQDRVTFQVSSRAALRDEYRTADVTLFPVVWTEPFGLVPLEAMACACPVVATGQGGSGEYLVDNANALLHPPGDPAALAAAVQRLADDTALRRRLVEGGLVTARAFGVDDLAETLEAWHRAAAEGFAAGRPPDRTLVI